MAIIPCQDNISCEKVAGHVVCHFLTGTKSRYVFFQFLRQTPQSWITLTRFYSVSEVVLQYNSHYKSMKLRTTHATITIWRSVPTSPYLLVFNWFDTHCKKNFGDKIGKWKDKQKSFLCGVRISDWPIWQFPLVPRLFKRLWWNSTFTTNMIVVQTKDKSNLPDELCLKYIFRKFF